MRLTPDACAAVYECLRQLSPFKGWKLPSSDEVEFAVTKDKKHFGTHTHYIGTDEHIIEISEENNGHFNTLATTMAHEIENMFSVRETPWHRLGTVLQAPPTTREAMACRPV